MTSKCQSLLLMPCSVLCMFVTCRMKFLTLTSSLCSKPLVLCCLFVPVSSKSSRPLPMVPVFFVCPSMILCRPHYMSPRVLFVSGILVSLWFFLCAVNPGTCPASADTRACA